MSEQLSPAAQAIDTATADVEAEIDFIDLEAGFNNYRIAVAAAALRAAADQVVPWRPEPTEESIGPTIDYGFAWALWSKANDARQELIAIAAELDGTQPSSENV
jgi:hypothetical protein